MDQDSSFVCVVRDLQAGDQAAAKRVFHAYFARLVKFSQARIARRYHAKADPEGVAASVLKTFFLQHATGAFNQLADWEELWRLLVHVAACKCLNRVRKLTRPVDGSEDGGRRREDREQGLLADGSWVADSVRPEDDVIAADLIDELTADWSAKERQVIDMSLDGREVKEIAEAIRQSERTVIRIRIQFKRRLEATLQSVEAAP